MRIPRAAVRSLPWQCRQGGQEDDCRKKGRDFGPEEPSPCVPAREGHSHGGHEDHTGEMDSRQRDREAEIPGPEPRQQPSHAQGRREVKGKSHPPMTAPIIRKAPQAGSLSRSSRSPDRIGVRTWTSAPLTIERTSWGIAIPAKRASVVPPTPRVVRITH